MRVSKTNGFLEWVDLEQINLEFLGPPFYLIEDHNIVEHKTIRLQNIEDYVMLSY